MNDEQVVNLIAVLFVVIIAGCLVALGVVAWQVVIS